MKRDDVTAVLVKLSRDFAIPADIQEVMMHGSPHRGIKPGALAAILDFPTEPMACGLADRVGEAMEDGGFWRSCTGCYDTCDGYPTGAYPYSAALHCDLGAGCRECGGLGAVWDDTDYDDMADFMLKYDRDFGNIKRVLIDGGVTRWKVEELTTEIMALDEATDQAPDHRRWVAALLMAMILIAGVATGWALGSGT